ncbi:MAG TPA: hypothetical protein VGD81_12055 [Opitutaceae bacterium]
MKRFVSVIALCVGIAVIALPLWAATGSTTSAPSDRSPAAPIAVAISTVTGIAISPLLGTGVYGAYKYFKTPAVQRDSLPWYARTAFWMPALIIVGACAAKDAFGAALPPGWKKPLDVLETIENKATGLIAAGAVVPFTMDALSNMILGTGDASTAALSSPLVPSGLAAIHVAAIDWSWLLNLLTVPFGLAVFVVVWMASHAINALILLSPWGAIDAALKAARTAVLGLITLSATLDPWIGAVLSLVVIVVAYFVAGWSFRLSVFATVFCWDFLTLRRRRFTPAADANWMFATSHFENVPARTYGRLVKRADGALSFSFRPWLFLPERSAEVPPARSLAVGRGLFFVMIDGESAGHFFLPPRYRGHEDELVAIYGFRGVREAGLRKAWGWIKETMGYGPRTATAASSP